MRFVAFQFTWSHTLLFSSVAAMRITDWIPGTVEAKINSSTKNCNHLFWSIWWLPERLSQKTCLNFPWLVTTPGLKLLARGEDGETAFVKNIYRQMFWSLFPKVKNNRVGANETNQKASEKRLGHEMSIGLWKAPTYSCKSRKPCAFIGCAHAQKVPEKAESLQF